MRKLFLHILFICLMTDTFAQPNLNKDDNDILRFGLTVGGVNTSISGLSKVLVSESYYTGYTFKNNPQMGFTGGIFINYKFTESVSALYGELSYSPLATVLHYSDINNFEYDFKVQYQYISLELWYKAYFFKGFYVGTGPRVGFNLTPGSIFYNSNGEDLYGPDIRIQQQMRDVLKGRDNFSFAVGLGYDFGDGIAVGVRYYQGIGDVMSTEVNNFNFIENRNTSRIYQFSLGYSFPYDFGHSGR